MEKIYVLGTGKLALHCAGYAKDRGKEVLLFEMAEKKSMFMETRAGKLGIPYFHEKKQQVFQTLLEETEEILLVSAINEYILPAEILEKENVTAINLHQALLPKHPGRNAECWAIFEQEPVSGITWHYMEKEVDKGDIIIRKEITLSESITAYELFQKQIQAAEEAFDEIFQEVINKTAERIPQEKTKEISYHKSWERPNGGYLDLGWRAEKISAFLRAMDYSILKVMEPPKLQYQGKTYQWKKYEIEKRVSGEEKITIEEGNIRLQKEGMMILLKNCKEQEI